MEERYICNIPALSEEECRALRARHVAVIGCGGLGGYLIELMARAGVGAITAVDGDVFELSNLNRQLLSEVSLLGINKARAAADRVARINPEVQILAKEVFLDGENAEELICGCDAVLDGLDSIPARKILAEACAKAGIPCVYGAVAGWVAQAGISLPGDGLIETLYPDGDVAARQSVLSFTPALCASLQAALCVKLLTGRPVETGTVYHFDLLHQEFEPVSMV